MYQLTVYDNAHYMDKLEAYTLDGFENYTAALAKAKSIVREDLESLYQPGMQSETLFNAYKLFGSDPVISPPLDRDEQFSAWQFAAGEAALICAARQGAGAIPVQVVGGEKRLTKVCFAPFGYSGNEKELLQRMLLVLHHFGRNIFSDFEVPLQSFFQTGQAPWYGSRTDIAGYRDYSLYHRFAYFPGNRFAGIHMDLCQSSGYDPSESRVVLRALGAEKDSMVYLEAALENGTGLICFSALPEAKPLESLFRVDEGGLIHPLYEAFGVPETPLVPNDYFRQETGFLVVIFSNVLYQDIRQATILKGFNTESEALQNAREAVERSVQECFRPFFTSADELFQSYMDLGVCALVFSPESACAFDAWAHARIFCERRFNPAFRPSM